MHVRICWRLGDFEDSVVLSGSLEEIQQEARARIEQVKPDDYWSEGVMDDEL